MHHTRKWHPLSFFVEARSNKRFSISGSWRSHIPRSLEFNFSHWGFPSESFKTWSRYNFFYIKGRRPSTNFMHRQMSLLCPQIFLWHGMWSVIYRQSSLATQLSDSKATAAVTAAAAAATTRAKRTHSETTLAEASEKADSRAEPRCATTCPRNCNQATNAVAVGEFSAATSAAGGRPSVISLH
jgi:hypothetical protein